MFITKKAWIDHQINKLAQAQDWCGPGAGVLEDQWREYFDKLISVDYIDENTTFTISPPRPSPNGSQDYGDIEDPLGIPDILDSPYQKTRAISFDNEEE